jgi:CBS domain-containing protein
MPQVAQILERKGSAVHTVGPQATVLDAVTLMNEHKIGALVVQQNGEVLGIFTERDLMRRVVGERLDPTRTLVHQVMTRDVVCCHLDDDLDHIRSILKNRRVRHLPVVDNSARLRGLISIGDVNAWMLDGQEATIHYLHEYIYGRV